MTTDEAIQLLHAIGQKIRQGEYPQAVTELRRLRDDEKGIVSLATKNIVRLLDGLLANQPQKRCLKTSMPLLALWRLRLARINGRWWIQLS